MFDRDFEECFEIALLEAEGDDPTFAAIESVSDLLLDGSVSKDQAIRRIDEILESAGY